MTKKKTFLGSRMLKRRGDVRLILLLGVFGAVGYYIHTWVGLVIGLVIGGYIFYDSLD